MKTWWETRRVTGDNTREQPYGTIQARATTKSNTFTIHYRVQSLTKRQNSTQNEWDENRDTVASEARGSVTLERYIDPNDPALPDFATGTLNDPDKNMDKYYRFRVIDSRRFDL